MGLTGISIPSFLFRIDEPLRIEFEWVSPVLR